MDLFEAIAARRSYRGAFSEEPVPQEDLRRIVQAGLQAPSGNNLQTTRFVIVDDPALVRQISAMPEGNTAMQQARAYIVCITDDLSGELTGDKRFQVEDCSAAAQNILLAVTALGYATVWIDGWLRREGRAESIGDLLGVPKGKIARIILPLGRPLEGKPDIQKLPFAERAWFNGYEGKG